MAKAVDCAPEEERPGITVWSPGLERHRRASTRLSLVGLRPRNPDSVSPSEMRIYAEDWGFKRANTRARSYPVSCTECLWLDGYHSANGNGEKKALLR